VGSDAGVGPPKPADAVRYAYAQLLRLGYAPIETLRLLTSVGADACGLGERKGRLAAGYDADILAVDGDPTADPSAMHRIVAVYARGQAIQLA
jgi:imidazolonepropionase-like amidohydrolase